MATSSPAPGNNSADTVTTTTPTPTPTTTAAGIATLTTITAAASQSPIAKLALTPQRDPPKSLRGLNKPKCSQCGNVARSRCPYVSCKSCCAKAQNPCPIHVLKQNGTAPDKTQGSASLLDQKSTDASSQGTSLRVSSLRQLSQFNGTQVPPRARRPLTRKDAAALNQWRFSKLKEYKERDIEAENEAFDRYMQNVSLLEEVFLANHESPIAEEMSALDPVSTNKEVNTTILLGIKAQLRSNPRTADNFKRRIQCIVEQGLRKSRKWDLDVEEETTDANDLDGLKEVQRQKKPKCMRDERASAVDELVDKLNKSRNEEELQSCLEMKFQLFNRHEKIHLTEKEVVETSKEKTPDSGPTPRNELKYRPPGLWTKVEIDQEKIHTIDMHFSSLDQIEDL